MIEKEELLNVLGENGELVIKKLDGTEIKKITKDNIQEVENIVSINYQEGQQEILVEINHAERTGILNLMHEKAILPQYKSRNEIKELTELIVEGNLQETENIGAKQTKANIQLKETQTKAEAEISNSQFIAGKTNENIEIKTTLVANESNYDLYKNPTIEVQFPEKVQDVTIKNVSLLYGEGLAKEKEEIYENEAGRKVARIQLVGEQTSYVETELVKGTNVILNCDVTVENLEENENHRIQVTCTNDKEVEYYNEGKNELEVNYVVTEEMKQQNYETAVKQSNEIATANEPITVTKMVSAGDGQDIYQGQVQKYTIKIKNNTNQTYQNITVKDEIPNELVYTKAVCDEGLRNGYRDDDKITTVELQTREIEKEEEPEQTEEPEEDVEPSEEEEEETMENIKEVEEIDPQLFQTLEPHKEIELCYFVRVKKAEENIGKKVGTKAQVILPGDETIYETNLVENTIRESKLQIDMVTTADARYKYGSASTIAYIIKIKNISNEKMTNLKAINQIPEGMTYKRASDMIYNEEDECYIINDSNTQKLADYNSSSKTVTWKVGDLEPQQEVAIYLALSLTGTEATTQSIANKVTVQADNVPPTTSNEETIEQSGVAKCTITKTTNLSDKYVYEGDKFEYLITVKNVGEVKMSATILDELPEGLILDKIITQIDEEAEKETISNGVNIGCLLEAGQTMKIRIFVEADNLPSGKNELEIRNKAKIENALEISETSNEVVNIIRKNPNKPSDGNDPSDNPNGGDEDNKNNSYSISGMAWIDENRNGAKDNLEESLTGVPVKLYDVNGKNIANATTGNDGIYYLNNINKGNYIVVFEYDNRNYALTEYRKAGVTEEKNSNVTNAQLQGKAVATTDQIRITNRNIENINMGVVHSDKFDLRLDKSISSITVQNGKASRKYSYNDANFVKIEVDRKTVNQTTVTIEYKIKVTNEGDMPGYAKEIVDYLPADLQFNEQLNKDWQKQEGQLVSKSLAGEIINPGESRTLNLIVSKKLTEDNLGTVTNTAEISEDYNENLIIDIDSTPGNKKAEEDDMSTVSVIIGLNTGRIIVYISLVLTTIAILATGTYLIKKKVLDT